MNARSVWAIIAGLLFIVVVTTLADLLMHAVGVLPPMGQPTNDALSLLALGYRVVISIGGAWITARLAPSQPMKHALRLGYIGVVLGVVSLLATWKLALFPQWNMIALVVLAIPQCWAGGLLFISLAPMRSPLSS